MNERKREELHGANLKEMWLPVQISGHALSVWWDSLEDGIHRRKVVIKVQCEASVEHHEISLPALGELNEVTVQAREVSDCCLS